MKNDKIQILPNGIEKSIPDELLSLGAPK